MYYNECTLIKDVISSDLIDKIEKHSTEYKKFLNQNKTERETIQSAIQMAIDFGYTPLSADTHPMPGDKIYWNIHGKGLVLAQIGDAPLKEGVTICISHADSPRLDLKPNPLYESDNLALLKTHYYGGIKKYQWVSIPLELRGIVSLMDGSNLSVTIGSQLNEPKFTITDLLPHLSHNQSKKSIEDAITGEELNILVGSMPLVSKEANTPVKSIIIEILKNKYGFSEDDFISAELSAIPSFDACDIGFDGSMIGSYGQDDRACTFAMIKSFLESQNKHRTNICFVSDKEEIGSIGFASAKSQIFDTFMALLCKNSLIDIGLCYSNSICISADATAGHDPTFGNVYEKNNSTYLNRGINVSKYTGCYGKSSGNDAPAELIRTIRKIFVENSIPWYLSEMGKVDEGGGGTVARYMADRGIPTIDIGIPILSMHSPYEIAGKYDCYYLYSGLKCLFECDNLCI